MAATAQNCAVAAVSGPLLPRPRTNLADVAHMVDPDWQGAGLGGILHDRAIEYARNHNVRGFTADVIVGNSRMLRVFRHGNHQINVTTEAGISEVTIIFPLSRDHHSETCGKWTEHLWPM